MSATLPLGVHAYVFGVPDLPEDWLRVTEGARRAGYELVEVPLLDAGDVPIDAIRRAMDSAGLSVSCSAGLTLESDLSSSDPLVSARGEQALLRAVDAAATLRSSILSGVVYGALERHDAPAAAAGRENCVRALARVARRAAELGLVLGVEPVNRYESNLLNTAAQAVALVRDVGEQNVIVHLDTYHMNIEETSFAAAVETAAALLGYVHVGESHRGALGTGTIDLDAFFHALHAAGYGGPIVFESFSANVSRGALAGSLAVWRELWSDPVEVARAARLLIERRLAAIAAA